MKQGWLAVLLALLVAGCSRGGYESQMAENFVNSCMARGSSKTYCNCMLGVFQSRISQSELITIETEMKSTGELPDAFIQTMLVVRRQCKQ